MDIIIYIFILFYSIILHEIAHGWAAWKNGDDTALLAGRMTLNPISHIDPIGSIMVPLLGYFSFGFPFGWAKPVPYNSNIVAKNKFGELQVSSAGVLTNFLLLIISVISFYILSYFGLINQDIYKILYLVATINIMLGSFNLLPFPPADGWHIFTEIYKHSRNYFYKIKSKIIGKTIYTPSYNNQQNIFLSKINRFFYNPIFMILMIYLAIQIFDVLTKYILSFVNYLFLLQ